MRMLCVLAVLLLTGPAAAPQDADVRPEDSLKWILNRPEFPAVRSLWNGIIDALIAKQPIPPALWKVFGREEQEAEALRPDFGPPGPREGAWILARLKEDGARAFNTLARIYGVAGRKPERHAWKDENFGLHALPGGLATRLLEIGVDETTFDELYGTILMMNEHNWALWFHSLNGEGWEVVLQILVHLRKKDGAKPMAPPVGREEAWRLASRGPWIRGIASALGRAFAAEKEGKVIRCGGQRLECIPVLKADPPSTWELAEIYRRMVRIDRKIGLEYFSPEFLAIRRARLPDPRYISVIDRDILTRVPGQGEWDRDTRRVAEAIIATMNLYSGGMEKEFLDQEYDLVLLSLIPELAKYVVEAARR
jgi:hypothetical protein